MWCCWIVSCSVIVVVVCGCMCWLVTGVGSQFLAIATGVLVMALMGMFNVHRHGSIDIAVIVLYALTSCMSNLCWCLWDVAMCALMCLVCAKIHCSLLFVVVSPSSRHRLNCGDCRCKIRRANIAVVLCCVVYAWHSFAHIWTVLASFTVCFQCVCITLYVICNLVIQSDQCLSHWLCIWQVYRDLCLPICTWKCQVNVGWQMSTSRLLCLLVSSVCVCVFGPRACSCIMCWKRSLAYVKKIHDRATFSVHAHSLWCSDFVMQ